MSSLHPSLPSPLTASLIPPLQTGDPSHSRSLIKTLHLEPHPEGGYFVETDRDPLRIPNPFTPAHQSDSTRNASTTIFYLLTRDSPKGNFHRNKGRTVHTLHRGRGQYVVIHPFDEDERVPGQTTARVETFVVGQDIDKGERLQWIVEGGRWKASFLLSDDDEGKGEKGGLLISETVVPGFDYADHDFLPSEKLPELVSEDQAKELSWLLKDH